MSYYECAKCLYQTKYKNDMRRHLFSKNRCIIIPLNSTLNDKELDDLSLETKKRDKDNKNFVCEFCNKSFTRHYTLKIHKETRCKSKDLILFSANFPNSTSSNSLSESSKNGSSQQVNIQKNIQNIQTQNINYNNQTNITFNIMCNSFDNPFDISHIDNKTRMEMIINVIYTKALQHILENKSNLNVYIEDGNENAIIYKNPEEKFVRIKKEDFTRQIMSNMKSTLQALNNETEKNPYLTQKIDEVINFKFDKYNEEKTTTDAINAMICKIYEDKKEQVLDIFQNIKKNGAKEKDILMF